MAQVTIRRATADDADFLVGLFADADVEPFLAASRSKDRDSVLAEIEESERDPQHHGLFVIEADGRAVGSLAFQVANRRSRIAHLGGLALAAPARGRGIADEAARLFQRHLIRDLAYHRLQMEVYGFNERALEHAERVGWVREGVRRKAYWRHGEWVDGILFGLIEEDLDP